MITLVVAGPEGVAQAQANMPRLHDKFITSLYGIVDDEDVMNGELIDVLRFKAKLLEAAREVLGKEKVYDVLLQTLGQKRV
jgi:hypothetical protein